MKKTYVTLICYILLFPFNGYSQTEVTEHGSKSSCSNAKLKWLSTDYMPGNIPAFEENKGQFPATVKGWKILYGCNYEGIEILLTDKGIIYNVSKYEKEKEDSEDDGNSEHNDPDESPQKLKTTYQHIFIQWKNASANPIVEAQDKTPYYFCEGMLEQPKKAFSAIRGFQKIVYHNLYPGIDLEFSFHKGKGVEYTIKVKPGFDAGVFKMQYAGASGLSFDNTHNLHIGTIMGDIIDYAPVVTSGGNEIPSSFQKTGKNEITIKFDNTNNQNEVVIDPWTVYPVAGGGSFACDVGIDAASNTYVLEYGGTGSNLIALYVQKYNTSGGLLWTYALNEFTKTPFNPIETDSSSSTSQWLDGFGVTANGTTYIGSPFGWSNAYGSLRFGTVSLNALGNRNYLNYTYSADSIYEPLNISYSPVNNLLVEAGTGPGLCCNHGEFVGVSIATGNPNPGEYLNDTIGEMYAGTIAPNGNYYTLSAENVNSSSTKDQLNCALVTNNSAKLLWQVATSYSYADAQTKETTAWNGTNGIAAGCEYLYTSDGLKLDQRSLTTGALIKDVTITGGSHTSDAINSGIAVDPLGNVYAGSDDAIYVYDKNLNTIGSYTGLHGKVWGVTYGNGLISACGTSSLNKGFVVQINPFPTSTDSVCSGNPATLSLNILGGPYVYKWSNGATTSSITVTDLATKTYTATVYGDCDSVKIIDTTAIVPTATLTSPPSTSVCSGGSTVLTVSGATTYSWTPPTGLSCYNCNNPTATPAAETVYTVVGTTGICSDTITDTVLIATSITPFITARPDTMCQGDTALLIAGGGGTYKWSTSQTNTSIKIAPTSTATYTLAATSGSCVDSTTVTIHVWTIPAPVISGLSQKCLGVQDTLTVSGGSTYIWNNGSTRTQYITGPINADSTITVVAYNGDCPDTAHFSITTKAPPSVSINSPVLICGGSPFILTANTSGTGPFTYLWVPGMETASSITANDSIETYTVYVTNSCNTSSKSITITPDNPSLNVCCNTTIMLGDDTVITASGTGIKSYQWSPTATCLNPLCNSVKVTPTVTTTYTVTGTDSSGCPAEKTITIAVETSPCFDFVIPNVLTPDYAGTGVNNMLYIKTPRLDSWSIVIYDRWGKEMFKSTNPTQYWKGTTESGGQASDGIYYYVINAECGGTVYNKQGFVQLIK